MGRKSACLLFLVTLAVGCGKKTAKPEVAIGGSATPPTAAPSPTAAPIPDAMLKDSLSDIDKKIAAQQYEAAVGGLVALNNMPKSGEQYNEYMKRLRAANDALSAKAAQGDAQALQTQMMLGRMLKGR